jgi:hypothetical protein
MGVTDCRSARAAIDNWYTLVRRRRPASARAKGGIMTQNEGREPMSDLPRGAGAPARRALALAGYTTLEQLTAAREADLLRLHGVGSKAIGVLREALAARGMAFAGGAGRVEELAGRFVAAADEVRAIVERCSHAQWHGPCGADERPVGVVAHHVAEVNAGFAGMVARFVAGETYTPQASMAEIHEENAQEAQQHAAVTKAEVLGLLHTSTGAVARELRSLSEAQLDQGAGEFGGHPLTVAQVVEFVVIGHTAEHLDSLRSAVSRAGGARS